MAEIIQSTMERAYSGRQGFSCRGWGKGRENSARYWAKFAVVAASLCASAAVAQDKRRLQNRVIESWSISYNKHPVTDIPSVTAFAKSEAGGFSIICDPDYATVILYFLEYGSEIIGYKSVFSNYRFNNELAQIMRGYGGGSVGIFREKDAIFFINRAIRGGLLAYDLGPYERVITIPKMHDADAKRIREECKL